MQVIATETEEADKVKSVVSLEEAAASKEAAGVKAIKVPDYSSCTHAPALTSRLTGLCISLWFRLEAQ